MQTYRVSQWRIEAPNTTLPFQLVHPLPCHLFLLLCDPITLFMAHYNASILAVEAPWIVLSEARELAQIVVD